MIDEIVEEWRIIPEFPNYSVSNLGRIYNHPKDMVMSTSLTSFGHVKITLTSEWGGERFTRSVAQLVAEAFVEVPRTPPMSPCDNVGVLDGNFSNVAAYNLMWRPRWFVWKYTRQLKIDQPLHYHNLQVLNTETGDLYESVIEAGMAEGLLFEQIWRSTYSGVPTFPNWGVYEITQ